MNPEDKTPSDPIVDRLVDFLAQPDMNHEGSQRTLAGLARDTKDPRMKQIVERVTARVYGATPEELAKRIAEKSANIPPGPFTVDEMMAQEIEDPLLSVRVQPPTPPEYVQLNLPAEPVERFKAAKAAYDEANVALFNHFEPLLIRAVAARQFQTVAAIMAQIPESAARFFLWRKYNR